MTWDILQGILRGENKKPSTVMVLIIFRDLRAVAIQETKKFLQIETVSETKKKQ